MTNPSDELNEATEQPIEQLTEQRWGRTRARTVPPLPSSTISAEGPLPSATPPPAPDAPFEPLTTAAAGPGPVTDQLVTDATALLSAALTCAAALPSATLTNAAAHPSATLPNALPIQRSGLDDLMQVILDRLDGQEARTNERLEAIVAAQEASQNQISRLQQRRSERRSENDHGEQHANPPPPAPLSVEERYEGHRRRPASIVVGSIDRRSRREPADEHQDRQEPPTSKSAKGKEKAQDEHHEPRQHFDKEYADKLEKAKKAQAFAVSDQDPQASSSKPWNNKWVRDPSGKGGKKYCNYHKRAGHTTEECRTLQQILLDKFKGGHIDVEHERRLTTAHRDSQFFNPEDENPSRQYNTAPAPQHITRALPLPPPPAPTLKRNPEPVDDPNAPAPRRRINMIMGGLTTCRDSVRSIKAYQRGLEVKRDWMAQSTPPTTTYEPITFTEDDASGLAGPHNDPLVVEMTIGESIVTKILIDTGSSVNVIFKDVLIQMEVDLRTADHDVQPLTGFDGDTVMTVGTIMLPVYVGGTMHCINFAIIDKPIVYNVILGTPWLHKMKAVASTYHQCVKFPTSRGIFTLRGDPLIARTCFIIERQQRSARTFAISDPAEQPDGRVRPNTELIIQVNIDPSDTTRCVGIGADLPQTIKDELVKFLSQNVETFAWSMSSMTGIDPTITCHELNVDPTFKPVKQKRRKLGLERTAAVNEEIKKLLTAGSIREVKYPDWLSNPVVVKKKNGKWRVCVDFTDLNKSCPKDSFPLPRIDQLVEATAGNELLSFMDAYSGYNQIMMHKNDQEKTAFITDQGTYCYKVMPFGLKNAGATYQRLVNRMFADQLGRTMEVYIDDMLVKSTHAADHVSHLAKCFEVLNRYNMKLNPAKCSFGVTSGEFLGYLVTKRGIEANPKQISALTNLPSPRNTREVQRLTGRIAALNRFISRSTDKCLPFYQLLRSNKKFEWDDKCESAFQELKNYLATPPVLAKPDQGETLYLYIAVSSSTVSGVLIKEDRGDQHPIFYVSKSLDGAELRYPTLEKLAYAVVISARKLRPYFQSHTVEVLTNQPLRTILHSPSQSGRLAKWAVELSEYDIEYKNRTCAKSQVLADFLVELSPELELGAPRAGKWSLHVDGASSQHGSGIGIHLVSPTGEVLEQSFRLAFTASNNEAEYEALIAGMRLAGGIGVKKLQVFCDSQLVTHQFSGDYECRNDRMDVYLKVVQELSGSFESFELTKISRSDNAPADALAVLASTSDPDLRRIIPVESIDQPSINLPTNIDPIAQDYKKKKVMEDASINMPSSKKQRTGEGPPVLTLRISEPSAASRPRALLSQAALVVTGIMPTSNRSKMKE
ncbi:PREDICTED: uncharacterized protein LOC104743154 [Camelina sativa]|uniref:Uncharacterized protein LOC104743154 n=1 Tax=Camelina sativa TaxID=90675 RepID=A0ABM0VXK4_CAMSA|nr:PREDICTED: uncharacterized protein LOC104743154 [Camelina sativa]